MNKSLRIRTGMVLPFWQHRSFALPLEKRVNTVLTLKAGCIWSSGLKPKSLENAKHARDPRDRNPPQPHRQLRRQRADLGRGEGQIVWNSPA